MASGTTQVNGSTVAYEVMGEGVPVVFVHAFPFDRSMWQAQVEALQDEYQVITLDLPGFGASAPIAEPTIYAFAEAVQGVLDAAAVRRPAIFVGLSMGGYVLFELWRQASDRFGALVLADTRAGADTEAGRANRFQLIEQVRARGASAVVEAMLGKMVTASADEGVRAQVRGMMEAANPEGVIGALHVLAARPDSTPDLTLISVPSMVIVGAEDGITPPSEAETMAAELGNVEVEVIEGAAHLSNVEQPQQFNAALLRFLNDLEIPRDWTGAPYIPEGPNP